MYLYCITNIVNQKIYLGVTVEPATRWYTHKLIAKGGKEKWPQHYQVLHSAIAKYGEENFSFEIIKFFDNEDECYFAESDYIQYLKDLHIPIYNVSSGGKGTGSGPNHPMFGKTLPDEWKQNVILATMRNASKPEVREKHSKNMIARNWVGPNHPMYGKTHSAEARAKISSANTGRPKSKETRQKISQANTGKVVTEETKQKLSIANKGKLLGEKNPNFGAKLMSKEVRHKIALSKKDKPSPTRKLNKDGVREVLIRLSKSEPLRKIAREMNIDRNTIKCIKNNTGYKDFILEIKNENNK